MGHSHRVAMLDLMNERPRHDPVERLSEHHGDDLLVIARTLGRRPDATSARAGHVDRRGIELLVDEPAGQVAVRVGFAEPMPDGSTAGLRRALRELARRARATGVARTGDGGAS